MFNNPARNPIFNLLTYRERSLRPRRQGRLMLEVVRLLVVVLILVGLFSAQEGGRPRVFICVFGIPISLLAPILLAQTAAQMMRHSAKQLGDLNLVRLTPLRAQDVVAGLFYAVLYRVRLVVAFVAIVIGLLVVVGAYTPLMQFGYLVFNPEDPRSFGARDYLINGLFWASIGGGLWLLYPLVILLEMPLVFKGRGALAATVGPPLRVVAVMLVLQAGLMAAFSLIGPTPRPTLGKAALGFILCPLPVLLLIILSYFASVQAWGRAR